YFHSACLLFLCLFFFHDPATSEIYTLSLHDALPIWFAAFLAISRRCERSARNLASIAADPLPFRCELHRTAPAAFPYPRRGRSQDRKSTRLNSSHSQISYAVFCLKKKKQKTT